MKYIEELDSIRAIAVLLVIVTHWVPSDHWLNIYTGIFNGVDIFFVLSGFLITRILLENRLEAEEKALEKSFVIKKFYVRRSLRIFPVYYLILIVLFILGHRTGTGIRENFFYFAGYVSNFYFFSTGRWDGMLSHLWSLAVEEQFYLLWPWLMLFANKKHLLKIIVCSIVIGCGTHLIFMDVRGIDILTFTCFDAFGLGALLSWMMVFQPAYLKKIYPYCLLLAIVCLALQIIRKLTGSSHVALPSRTLTAVFTFWIICFIVLKDKATTSVADIILRNRALMFMGKISYGMYLYHLVIPHFTYKWFNMLNGRIMSNSYSYCLMIIENFVFLVLVSYSSWIIIEKPCLELKRYFPYLSQYEGARAQHS